MECMWGLCIPHIPVEIRGLLAGASLLSSMRFCRSNSGHQGWQQIPLLAELSLWPPEIPFLQDLRKHLPPYSFLTEAMTEAEFYLGLDQGHCPG